MNTITHPAHETPEKTLGETRVRADFNVSKSGTVDLIKQKTAELINLTEGMRKFEATADHPAGTLTTEGQRLISLAQTAYEEAAMWAVKAATI
jgi:hypothetical protein